MCIENFKRLYPPHPIYQKCTSTASKLNTAPASRCSIVDLPAPVLPKSMAQSLPLQLTAPIPCSRSRLQNRSRFIGGLRICTPGCRFPPAVVLAIAAQKSQDKFEVASVRRGRNQRRQPESCQSPAARQCQCQGSEDFEDCFLI